MLDLKRIRMDFEQVKAALAKGERTISEEIRTR